MPPRINLLTRLRRLARRHPRLAASLRSATIFLTAFGGAYGFISGSRSDRGGYDPHAFAIGASFLFALACVALAALSVRLRLMKRDMKKLVLHNEALSDRNWELKEAEDRARTLLQAQAARIASGEWRRCITCRIAEVNDGAGRLASSGGR